MVSPSLLVIALVAAYPIGYAIWLSLHEYSLITKGLSRWSGFANYSDALWGDHHTEFWNAFKTIFDPDLGFANSLLRTLHLPGGHIVWLGQSGYALAVVIFADVWKTTPFMALLLLAGLQVIPEDVYDAAKVDGATAWQRFRRITLPLLTPAILVALIFRTLDALRIFDLPYVLTKGTNGTETLSLDAQQTLVNNGIIGLGSALSVLTFATVMLVSFLYIRFVGGNIRALAED